jgi:putative transposase
MRSQPNSDSTLSTSRKIRVLRVIDRFTWECLTLEVDTSFASPRVTRAPDEIVQWRGQPQSIRCDNGPELTSSHFLALVHGTRWCMERGIDLVHIQPGRPMQNGHVESFAGKLRTNV